MALRVAVVGAGAVGGYFGGRLGQAGEELVVIARGQSLAAIRARGLRITSGEETFIVRPALVTDDPAAAGPVDAIILGVKAWQVPEAARAMRPLVGAQTCVVPLQNGIEAPELLARELGEQHVLGGLCRIFAYLDAPGEIRHAGVDPYIAFGELDGSASERVQRLLDAFSRARGVTAEVPADIRVAMWSKFLLITAMSGLGAVTRAPVGIFRGQAETRELLLQVLHEIQAVAVAHGIPLGFPEVAATLAFIDAVPPDGTTSMQRDIMQGRPSELEAQTGAVVRLGHRLDVPVPANQFIYSALLALERRARGELQFG